MTPAQRDAQQKFRDAIRYMKWLDAREWIAATAMSNGTGLLPRDILLQNFYGRTFMFQTTDKFRWYSMASRRDVSLVFDSVTQQPGSMVFRGTEWWLPVPPGLPGQVLRFNALNVAPSWENPATGGGGDPFQSPPPYDPSTNSAAHGGNIFLARLFQPQADTTMSDLRLWLRAFTGTLAYAGVYESATGALTGSSLIAQGTAAAPTTGAVAVLPLNATINLDTGKSYWIGACWNGGGTVTPAIGPTFPTRFFAHSTATLPATAPASSAANNNYFPAWIT